MEWIIALIGGMGIGIVGISLNINPILIFIACFVFGLLVGRINDM